MNGELIQRELVHEVERLIGSELFLRVHNALREGKSDSLNGAIADILAPFRDPDPKSRDKRLNLLQTRIELEAAFLSTLREDPFKRLEAKARVEPIQEEMRNLVDSGDCSEYARDRFWELDGEFHIALGEFGDATRMREIVRSIQNFAYELAAPSSLREMRETCDEHDRILDLIMADEVDDNVIVEAIRQHATRAFQRWYSDTKSATPSILDLMDERIPTRFPASLDELNRLYARELRARVAVPAPGLEAAVVLGLADAWNASGGDLSYIDCDYVLECLLLQHRYPDEHVIFSENVEQIRGCERFQMKVLFHSADWDKAQERWETLSVGERKAARLEFFPDPLSVFRIS